MTVYKFKRNTYAQKISNITSSMPWLYFRSGWDVQIRPVLARDRRSFGVIFHLYIRSDLSNVLLKVSFRFKKGINIIPVFTVFNITSGEKVEDEIDIKDTKKLYYTISKVFGETNLAKMLTCHSVSKRVDSEPKFKGKK